MKRGFTREWHRAKIGTTQPALCGKKPPGGRPWKEAPKERSGVDSLPPCPRCLALEMQSHVWLAS